MSDFTTGAILSALLFGTGWTVLLSLSAVIGGAALGLFIMLGRLSRRHPVRLLTGVYVEIFQGTPLLVQLFIIFFGLPIIGIDPSAFVSAAIGLILFSAAFLGEIWRGCIQSVPKGQWEASASLAMGYAQQLRHVIFPSAFRVSLAPTVGFLVQVVKGTSLTSIIGFVELSRTGLNLSNTTFQPFLIFGLVGALYFALCAPLSALSRFLETHSGRPRSV